MRLNDSRRRTAAGADEARGFSPAFMLLEAAVALAVFAIGVLSLFGLLSAGLESSMKANADGQAAMFADNTFNTLRARSDTTAETNAWENFWGPFAAGDDTVPVAAQNVWVVTTLVVRAGALCTNVYRNWGFHAKAETAVIDHTLRYRLDVTFRSTDDGSTNRADVLLKVWEGEFGPARDENARVFYAEFDNAGGL